MKHPCIVLYNDCSFSSDPVTNMATTGHSWFWLADFWKHLLLWNPFAKWIQFGRKHPWKDLWLTYIKIAHLVAIRKQTWPPQAIFASDWLISKKSSPLKPLCRINRNFIGSILGRTSIKIAHLVAIREQTWPSQAILVSAWLISKKCSLLKLSTK